MGNLFSQRGGMRLDPIMAIDELFRSDQAGDKINLVVGVFQNHEGLTPVLESVKLAEAQLVETESTKAYLPIAGEPSFVQGAEVLVFGVEGQRPAGHHIASVQTPGSTAALRIAAELIKQGSPASRVWIGTPAYSNHKPIFGAAGLGVADYRYYDRVRGALLFDEMLSDLSSALPGDVVLLHACCHNPTGADMKLERWESLARFMCERSLIPLIDAAYLGFAYDIGRDAANLRALAAICPETMVATSFSKNFALYSERLGLLSFVSGGAGDVLAATGHAKVCARALYSSPPSHGAKVVARILNDSALRALWLKELEGMRQKLLDVRYILADGLEALGVKPGLFPSLRQNRGMFTLSQLTTAEVLRLREQHHIYVLDNGRVSFGGMRKEDIGKLCAAIAQVT
jgi:aspartate/tyrosine/aromatic aminotransferase